MQKDRGDGFKSIKIRVWAPVTSSIGMGNYLIALKLQCLYLKNGDNSVILTVLLRGLYAITHIKQLAECLAYHNRLSLQLVFAVKVHFSGKKVDSFHWIFRGLVTKQRWKNTVLHRDKTSEKIQLPFSDVGIANLFISKYLSVSLKGSWYD